MYELCMVIRKYIACFLSTIYTLGTVALTCKGMVLSFLLGTILMCPSFIHDVLYVFTKPQETKL